MDIAKAYVQIIPTTTGIQQNLQSAMTGAGNAAGTSAGKSAGSRFASALGKGLKVGTAAVGVLTAGVAVAGTAFAKSAGSVAEYGDNIDKMSQKMGLSAEAYQEWDAVLQHSGSSIDAMKTGMRTLANAVEKGNQAFERIGLTQEEIASMSQEQLFEATIAGLQNVTDTTERTYLAGQLLGRGATELGALLNTSAEDTQKMRDRVHELGGVMSDEAVKAAAQYQDSLQDLQAAMQGTFREASSQFLPGMISIMDGLTSIFAGEEGGTGKVKEGVNSMIGAVEELAPKFVQTIGVVGSAVASAVVESMPDIASHLVGFVGNAITGLVEASPKLMSAVGKTIQSLGGTLASEIPKLSSTILKGLPGLYKNITDGIASIEIDQAFVDNLATGIQEGIPQFFETVLPLISEMTGVIGEKAGDFIEIGITIISSIVKGIVDSIPVLIENIPTIISNIANIINKNAPKLLMAGVELIIYLVKGIITSIPVLIENIPKIAQAIFDVWSAINWVNLGTGLINAIKNGVKAAGKAIPEALKSIGTRAKNFILNINWASAGKTIVSTLGSGVKAVGRFLWNALKSIAKTAIDKVKNVDWLGLGKNIVLGIRDGILSMPGTIVKALAGIIDKGIEGAKKRLGIASPSKVFRDEVGINISKGMALGIEDGGKAISKAIGKTTQGAQVEAMARFSVAEPTPTPSQNAQTTSDELLLLLSQYLPIIADKNMTVDGASLNKGLAPGMNKELGLIGYYQSREVII